MARSGENIRLRKDGRWEARYIRDYDQTGKAIYGYIYGESYEEAKAKKICALNGLYDWSPEWDKAGISVYDAVMDWLINGDMKARVKPTTFDKYEGLIRRYIWPFFCGVDINSLSTAMITAFSNKLLEKGGKNGKPLSSKTVIDVLILLKQAVNYLNENGNPLPRAVKFILPKMKVKKVQTFTFGQIKKIYKALSPQIHGEDTAILLAIMTGMRIGELCGLKWGDIDFAFSTITVSRTVSRIKSSQTRFGERTMLCVDTPKTENSVRIIPLNEASMEFLKSMHKEKENFLVTGSTRIPDPRNVYNRYKRLLNELGLPDYTFHALRHTFATKCVEVGFDPKSLSEILGHADVSITMRRYVHPTLDMKRSQMEKFLALAKN